MKTLSDFELLEYFHCQSAGRFGQCDIVDTPNWHQVTSPHSASEYSNSVSRSVLSEEKVEQVITQTIEKYRHFGSAFRWTISENSQPGDLAIRLINRGFTHVDTLIGMIGEHVHLTLEPDPSIEVQAVRPSTLEQYISTLQDAWRINEASALKFKEEANQSFIDAPISYFFQAFYEGIPAGVGSLTIYPEGAYLNGSAVLPEFRNKGIYRQLIKKRVEFLTLKGHYRSGILAIASTSAPICEKMGFKEKCRFQIYRFQP